MDMQQRLEALERSNRRLRGVVSVLGLGVVGFVGMGMMQQGAEPGAAPVQPNDAGQPAAAPQTQPATAQPAAAQPAVDISDVPAVIRAQAFELVGSDGRIMATLKLTDGGGAAMQTFNGKGNPAVSVSVDREGNGAISMFNRDGVNIARFGANQFGGTFATFNDKGKSLAHVGANSLGQGTVSLYSANSAVAPIVALGGTESGDGTMTTYSGGGQRLVAVGATSGGVGKITTFNNKGRERVELGSTAAGGFVGTFGDGSSDPIAMFGTTINGDGIMRTYSSAGKPLCGMEVGDGGLPKFAIYDANGQIASVLP